MKEVYGEQCLARCTIFLWYQRYEAGRVNIKDLPRPGQADVVTNSSTISAVDELIQQITTCEVAVELPISKGTSHSPQPSGVFSPKLSRILPPKVAVSPSPAWLKKFEPTVIQNPMTIGRFFIIVIEKHLGKESNSKRCVPIFRSCGTQGHTDVIRFIAFACTDCFQHACAWR
ncbi:hypothetical protein AVEN_226174-1 [Araneus ventricosus]|uniref:Mos1 transposase HTH domain-containing protein n=1 Tax=Araneus ventricosus TaxID=182803 RepID=A0A4Y2BEN7_ARAVE|nr:hypothetical protein AVEN_226174-1 [Araneus ventricosus]